MLIFHVEYWLVNRPDVNLRVCFATVVRIYYYTKLSLTDITGAFTLAHPIQSFQYIEYQAHPRPPLLPPNLKIDTESHL